MTRSIRRTAAALAVVGAVLLTNTPPASAAPVGSRDGTFSTDGLVAFTNRYLFAMAPTPDGGLASVVIRDSDASGTDNPFRVLRHSQAGGVIPFGSSGNPLFEYATQGVSGPETAVAYDDGRLIVAGYHFDRAGVARVGLARLDPDGTYDTTFSGDGRLTTKLVSGAPDVSSTFRVHLLPDGDIVVAVYSVNFDSNGGATLGAQAVARFNADGGLDTGFSGDGKLPLSSTAGDVAVQPDGTLYISDRSSMSNYAEVTRYLPSGNQDFSFGGFSVSKQCGSFVASFLGLDGLGQPILACLRFNSAGADVVLYRWEVDGTFDTTFGVNGKALVALPLHSSGGFDLDFDSSGRFWLVGNSPSNLQTISLARVATDGTLDTSFSGDGRSSTTLPWVATPTNIAVGGGRAYIGLRRTAATTIVMAIQSD